LFQSVVIGTGGEIFLFSVQFGVEERDLRRVPRIAKRHREPFLKFLRRFLQKATEIQRVRFFCSFLATQQETNQRSAREEFLSTPSDPRAEKGAWVPNYAI
jgi:hypothetical protein